MLKRALFGLVLALASASAATNAQRSPILRDVKAVQVNPTVVANPDKVKADFAPALLQDALRSADIDTPKEASIRAHLVVDEFTSGSTARRFIVGFGAGRSTVDARLVFQSEDGKQLASTRIRVRGSLAWGAYQGADRQRSQAVNSFDERLREEIAKLR